MDYKVLQEANALIDTTPIQGKQYAEVPQRVKAFRYACPDGSIETELLSNENGVCIFRAVVRDGDGRILGTGTAYEKEGAGFINKTSYIENCETSAVGRALGMCGFGIDTSMASYEEVANARLQQGQEEHTTAQPKKYTPKKEKAESEAVAMREADLKAKVMGYINRHGYSKEQIDKICASYKVDSLSRLNIQQCQHYIKFIENKGGSIDE